MIGERTVQRQSSVSVSRKRLADVTNSPAHAAFPRDDYVNRLVQENLALTRALEDKNKAFELNTAELNRLRAMNQKMQMQNWSLAQSNSQMLAELKLGREKMKTLQHELVCKIVLLKAKDSELQRKAGDLAEIIPLEVATDPLDKPEDVARTYNHTGKQATKSQYHCQEKEMAKPKRHCMRRHSAQFIFQDQEATVCSTPRGPGRTSMGRPSRRAAEKLQRHFQADTLPRIQRMRQKEQNLQRRLLRVMRIVEALEGKGYRLPVVKGEAQLADKLAIITKQLKGSGAELSRRVQSLLVISRSQADGVAGSLYLPGSTKIDGQSLADLQEVLQQQTEAIARLGNVLKRDIRDMEIMIAEDTEMTEDTS